MKNQKAETANRKRRTRTLIQVGGLVRKAGLFDLCGIDDGEDLQDRSVSQDKAAILLGWLDERLEKTINETGRSLSETDREDLRQRGIRRLHGGEGIIKDNG